MKGDILEIMGLRTSFPYGKEKFNAVDGIDLRVGRNESVALVGESGCGKTLTGLSIMKLVPSPGRITDGQILLEGEDILQMPESNIRSIRGKKVSMVFQDPSSFLNPTMTIGEQVSETLILHQGLTKSESKLRVIEILKTVRIPHAESMIAAYPHELSGGMKQRVLIAIAIACSPSLVIADEPTTALDATIQRQILNLIMDVRETFEISLLLITHDLGIVAEICDRVYVMYAGKIAETADVFQLFREPAHPYTRGLLESTKSIYQYVGNFSTIDGVVPDLRFPPPGCRFHPRCKFAMPICTDRDTPETVLGDQHRVFCELYAIK